MIPTIKIWQTADAVFMGLSTTRLPGFQSLENVTWALAQVIKARTITNKLKYLKKKMYFNNN